MPTIEHIAMIGGGVMGRGIGQALLQGGRTVTIREVDPETRDEIPDIVESGQYGLESAVEYGHISEQEKTDALDRLTVTGDIGEAVSDANLVIEAVPEDLALKGEVFRELDELTDEIPLASNTGGYPITSIANAVEDPSRIVGTHFFNPVPVMDLVEIIQTPKTDDTLVQKIADTMEDIGKHAVVVNDSPENYGFVANRVFWAMLEEAKAVVQDGVATEEKVDQIMEHGFNHPAGPFKYIDPDWNT